MLGSSKLIVSQTVAVWLLGYGALRAFAIFGTYPSALPDLNDFSSATWGDGLALPVYAGSLLILRSQFPHPSSPVVRISAGVLGAAGGTAVIASWIMGDGQALNWTMPLPGVLNAAGIYHAAFLILASGYFSYLTFDTGQRVRTALRNGGYQEPTLKLLNSGALTISVASIIAYSALAIADSAKVATTRAGLSSVVALGVVVIAILGGLIFVAGPHMGRVLLTLFSGCLTAGAFACIVLFSRQDWVVYFFIVAALLFGLCVGIDVRSKGAGRPREVGSRLVLNWQEMLAVASLWSLFVVAASRTRLENPLQLSLLGLLLIVVVGLALVLRRSSRSDSGIVDDYSWLVVACVFLATTSGALLIAESDELSTSFFFALLAAVLAGPTIRLCKRDFQVVMDMETSKEARRNGGKFTPRQERLSKLTHIRLITCLIATTLAILGLSLLTARHLAWNASEVALQLDAWSWTVVAFFLVVSAALATPILRAFRMGKPRPLLTGAAWHGAVLILCLSAALVAGFAASQAFIDRKINMFAVVQAVFLALFAFECMYGNGIRLRLLRPNLASKAMVLIVGVSLFAIAYWSLTVGVRTEGQPVVVGYSLLALMACYVMVAIIVLIATTLPRGSGAVSSSQFDKPVLFAGQSMALLLPMWIFSAWIPQTIAAHIPAQPSSITRWIMIALVLIGFIALYVSVLLWLAKNNDTHNSRFRRNHKLPVPFYFQPEASHLVRFRGLRPRLIDSFRKNEVGTDAERQAQALSSHTAVQNAVSFCIVSSTVLGFFWLIPSDLQAGILDGD